MNAVTAFLSRWENLLVWFAIALAAKYLLRWSFKEIFAAAMHEIRDTVRVKPSVGGLNGMGVTLIFLLICGLIFWPSLAKLAALASQAPASSLNPNIALASLVLIFVFSLICVLKSGTYHDN